jgi:hypothetical protein
MNTSHHDGGAPDVFLKNASDATLRDLQTLDLATQGIRHSLACLHRPDLCEADADFYRDNHDAWHRDWCRASKRLMKQEKLFNNRRHRQLEMEGLVK